MAARKKKEPEMREYLCKGSLSLTGVIFTIEAASLEEAQQKARDGQWTDYDVSGASSSNCEMYESSVEENC